MPTLDTPWGPRLYSKTDEAFDKIRIEMWDDDDALMADIAYYNKELIEKYEDRSMTTMDVVEWMLDEDEKTYKQMTSFVKSVIKSQKQQLKEWNEVEKEIEAKCGKLRGKTIQQKKDAKEFSIALYVTPYREEIETNLKKNQQLLALAGKTPEGEASNPGLDFERAKLVPIDSIIEIKRGFAPCLWHDEKTPSMKYYKKNNRVHCFGCGKGGDVIDVVQQIKDCDIKEAVRFLTNA